MLEDSYCLAFAALDLIIGFIDDAGDRILPSAHWKRVEALTAALRAIGEEDGIAGQAELMIRKLPELRRAPTKDRVIRAAGKSCITVDDLWPRLGFEGGLARATKARNELFHAARTEDPSTMIGDRLRIAALTEGNG
jgi:hypothetical protein